MKSVNLFVRHQMCSNCSNTGVVVNPDLDDQDLKKTFIECKKCSGNAGLIQKSLLKLFLRLPEVGVYHGTFEIEKVHSNLIPDETLIFHKGSLVTYKTYRNQRREDLLRKLSMNDTLVPSAELIDDDGEGRQLFPGILADNTSHSIPTKTIHDESSGENQ